LALIFYTFVLAVVFAFAEVQIEGVHGWAEKLPTWRAPKKSFWGSLMASVMNGKELTGYHICIWALIILIFHFPFVTGLPLTLNNWLMLMVPFILFIGVWDFLWFIFNPAYGLRSFRPGSITWHKDWFLGMPVDYWKGIILTLVLAYFMPNGMQWWLSCVVSLGALTAVTTAIFEAIRNR